MNETKVAIICNNHRHVEELLIQPLKLDRRKIVTIVAGADQKMRGYIDMYYYELRPMYAREQDYANQHGWKSINKTELKELAS